MIDHLGMPVDRCSSDHKRRFSFKSPYLVISMVFRYPNRAYPLFQGDYHRETINACSTDAQEYTNKSGAYHS